jgi:hypothetical protein
VASLGLNVDRSGRHSPDLIRSQNSTWQRIVALPDIDLSVHFRNCRQAGVQTLLALARESAGDYARYNRLYGSLVSAVQVGNEPDLESDSSWTMTQGELVALGKAARSAFGPTMPLVAAGLASGHPEWLDGVDLSPFDAIAFHPYLKDAPNPDDLEDLPDVDALAREYARFGKPLIISEWGWWSDQEPRASEEVRDMIRWAARTDLIDVFFYFCTDDLMVPPFGLLDAQGRPKPRARAFRDEAANAIHSLWPTVTEPPVDPELPQPGPALPNAWLWWTADQIATAAQCPIEAVREHWPRLAEQLNHCGILEKNVAIALIGTIAIESASTFRPIHEYRNADGSIPAVWHTYDGGPAFHGRGFIQLTHRSNYAAYGPKVAALWGAGGWEPDFDLVGDPDRALDPDIAAAVAALYFRDAAGGALLVAARAGQWDQVRRYVLGGPDPNGSARIARIAQQLGAVTPQPIPPAEPDVKQAYEIALKTLRDETLPAIRREQAAAEERLDKAQAMLDEARRIVAQMVGPPA